MAVGKPLNKKSFYGSEGGADIEMPPLNETPPIQSAEDKALIHKLNHKSKVKHKKDPKKSVKKRKIEKVMEEWKEGELHSGSKKGPVVKKRSQAIAIALSEARKAKKKSKK